MIHQGQTAARQSNANRDGRCAQINVNRPVVEDDHAQEHIICIRGLWRITITLARDSTEHVLDKAEVVKQGLSQAH